MSKSSEGDVFAMVCYTIAIIYFLIVRNFAQVGIYAAGFVAFFILYRHDVKKGK